MKIKIKVTRLTVMATPKTMKKVVICFRLVKGSSENSLSNSPMMGLCPRSPDKQYKTAEPHDRTAHQKRLFLQMRHAKWENREEACPALGGGRRRIRTFEGVSQQIYSLPSLAT